MKTISLIYHGQEKTVTVPVSDTVGKIIREHLSTEAKATDDVEDLECYHNERQAELRKDQELHHLNIHDGDKLIFSRCKRIAISVKYNGHVFKSNYLPIDKIKKVKKDACDHFQISGTDAADLQLYLSDSKEPLPAGTYLAFIASYPHCSIELDLSKDIAILG